MRKKAFHFSASDLYIPPGPRLDRLLDAMGAKDWDRAAEEFLDILIDRGIVPAGTQVDDVEFDDL
jgi:hypothetical protein